MVLHLMPGIPGWLAATVTPALVVHVSAGSIAILSGATALVAAKGERLHRASGTVFFVAMLIMAAMATYLAVLYQQKTNLVAGPFVFYLVGTAWLAVRRKHDGVGWIEKVAPLVALGVAATLLTFGLQGLHSAKGLVDGAPAQASLAMAAVAALAAALDLKVILKGDISGTPRIARHLWRMCFALFIASGSFFLGQQKVMPKFLHGSPVLLALALAPLVLMIFWLVRVRFTGAFRGEETTT